MINGLPDLTPEEPAPPNFTGIESFTPPADTTIGEGLLGAGAFKVPDITRDFAPTPTIAPQVIPDFQDLPEEFSDYIKSSTDPMAAWARIKSSKDLADILEVNPADVFNNHDAYFSEYLGRPNTTRSDWQAFTDTLKATRIQSAMAMELGNALESGDWTGALQRVAALKEKLPSEDTLWRGAPMQWAKSAATFIAQQEYQIEQIPQDKTLQGVAYGVAAGIGGAAMVGAAGGSALPGIGTAIGALGGGLSAAAISSSLLTAGLKASYAKTGGKMEAGGALLQMMQMGVPLEDALPYAIGVGAAATGLEALGLGGMTSKLFAGSIAKRAAKEAAALGIAKVAGQQAEDMVAKQLEATFKKSISEKFTDSFVKGKFVAAATKKIGAGPAKAVGTVASAAIHRGVEANWESSTEAITTLVTDMAANAAADAYNKTIGPGQNPASTMTGSEIIKDMTDTFVTMWQGAFLTMGAAHAAKGTYQLAKNALAAQAKPETSTTSTESTPSTLTTQSPEIDPAKVYRKPDGTLYTEVRQGATYKNEAGETVTDAILKVGNPDTKELTAYASLSIEGDKVRIKAIDMDRPDPVEAEQSLDENGMPIEEEIQVPPSMAPIFKDTIKEVMRKFPGLEIEIDTADPTLQAVVDELKADSPRAGKVQWFDKATNQAEALKESQIRDTVRASMGKDGDVAANTIIALAKARWGKDWVPRWNAVYGEGTGFIEASTLADLNKGDPGLGTRDAQIAFYDARGNPITTEPGQPGYRERGVHSISRADLGNIRARMTFTEGTTLASAIHEFFHGLEILDFTDGEVHEFEKVLGKERAQWGTAEREKLADLFEPYLFTGKAPTKKLETVFFELAKQFRRFVEEWFNIAKRYGQGALTPELRAAYDKLFQESPMLQEVAREDNSKEAPAETADSLGSIAPEDTVTTLGHPVEDNSPEHESQRQTIAEVVRLAEEDKTKTHNRLLKDVTEDEALRVLNATGIDIRGYKHYVDSGHIRHILGRHGNPEAEWKTYGQIAVTKKDFLLLPEILDSPDSISRDGDALVYKKTIGNEVIVVENVRNPVSNGRRLEFSSLTKKPVPGIDARRSAPDLTSETSREPADSSIDQPEGDGNTLAHTTDTPAFRKWFGDSKVVDSEGKPLVVYHGTDQAFDAFDPNLSGKKSKTGAPRGTFFFTDAPDVAGSYTVEWQGDFSAKLHGGANIMAYFLSMKNPLVVNAKGENWQDIKYKGEFLDLNVLAERAMAAGHDGLIVRNVKDKGVGSVSTETATTYVAFSPTQIKSVNNRGTWDPNDSNTLAHTRTELVDLAKKDATFEEFKEWMDFADSLGDFMEPETPTDVTDREAWLREIWDEAHKVEPTEKDTSDQAFLAEMRKPGGVEKFLQAVWDTLSGATQMEQYGAMDAEEQRNMEEMLALRDSLQKALDPTVLNNATRMGQGKSPTDRARKSILSLMREGALDYKAFWAEMSGDEELLAQAKEEMKARAADLQTLPDPKGARLDDISIADWVRLSRSFENEETRKAIESGDIGSANIQQLVDSLDEEKKALEAKIGELKKRLADDESHFSWQERKFLELNRTLKEKERALVAANRKAKEMGERAEKYRSSLPGVRAESREKGRQEGAAKARAQAEQEIAALRRDWAREKDQIQSDRWKLMEQAILLQQQIDEAKEQGRANLRKWRAADDLKKYRNKLIHYLQKPPSTKRVHWDEVVQIRDLQAYLRDILERKLLEDDISIGPEDVLVAGKDSPVARAAIMGTTWAPADLAKFLDANPEIKAILGKRLISKIEKRDPAAISLADLESLREKIDRLKDIGKRKLNERLAREKAIREGNQETATEDIRAKKGYKKPEPVSTEEQKKQVKKMDLKNKVPIISWDDHRLYRLLDGMKKGINHYLLRERALEVRRQELVASRKRIDAVMKVFKESGLKPAELYTRTVTVEGIGPTPKTFTLDQLMFYALAVREESSREHIMFGNIFTDEERLAWKKSKEITGSSDAMRMVGEKRLAAIEAAINANLGEKEWKVLNAIADDWDAAYEPMAKAAIQSFNEAPAKVAHYVALQVIAKGSDQPLGLTEMLKADLIGRHGQATVPEKGMTKARIKISPENQREVRDDLLGVWTDSVNGSEHFIASTPLVRELNATYRNGRTAAALREQIRTNFGQGMIKRIDETIQMLANPRVFDESSETDRVLRTLRGNYGIAVMGGRLSTIVTQAITNPLPFFAYAPVEMAKNLISMTATDPIKWLAKTWGKMPVETQKSIAERTSAILQALEGSPVEEAMSGVAEKSKIKRGQKKLHDVLMGPLSLVVKFINAAGWKSAYERAKIELGKEEGITPADLEARAIAKADEILLEAQPSYRAEDLAPMFRPGGKLNELAKSLNQFAVPLGTGWQQATADIPYYLKNKKFGTALGLGIAYPLMGALLYAKAEGGPDGEDDEAWWKGMMYHILAWVLDYLPFGNVANLDKRIEGMVTGKGGYNPPRDMFPWVTQMMNGAEKGSAQDMGMGLMYLFGGPAVMIKEWIRALGGDPGALLGKRKE